MKKEKSLTAKKPLEEGEFYIYGRYEAYGDLVWGPFYSLSKLQAEVKEMIAVDIARGQYDEKYTLLQRIGSAEVRTVSQPTYEASVEFEK